MTNYVLNEDKMFSDISDNIAIIINSKTGIYYSLNAFGTLVFTNIINGVPVETLKSKILSIIENSNNFEKHFDNFINTLCIKEILIPGPQKDADITLDENIIRQDDYELIFKEYSDAQEMLLADPIHEVKEEIGWTPEQDSIGYTKEETKEREKKVKN